MHKNDAYLDQIHKDNIEILNEIKKSCNFFNRKYKSDIDFDTFDETFIFEGHEYSPTIEIIIPKSKLDNIKITVHYIVFLFKKNSRVVSSCGIYAKRELSINEINKKNLKCFIKIDGREIQYKSIYKGYDFFSIVKEFKR